jgi:hypothetical protein
MAAVRVRFGEQEVALGERSVRIVRFVAEHATEIERIPVGRLVLNFKGRNVAPELTRHFRLPPDDDADH